MGVAEGVIDVHFPKSGQFGGKTVVVLLLFNVKTEVLQQEDISRLQGVDHLPDLLADAVRGRSQPLSPEDGRGVWPPE